VRPLVASSGSPSALNSRLLAMAPTSRPTGRRRRCRRSGLEQLLIAPAAPWPAPLPSSRRSDASGALAGLGFVIELISRTGLHRRRSSCRRRSSRRGRSAPRRRGPFHRGRFLPRTASCRGASCRGRFLPPRLPPHALLLYAWPKVRKYTESDLIVGAQPRSFHLIPDLLRT
jgi:hypothetical protein